MNKHLDEYLCKKYPLIFADRNKPMNQTCMCWGFSHGDGWFFLLDTLCSSIQHHIDNPHYVFKKTPKVYCMRAWNWIAQKLHLPYSWHWYGDMCEPGPKLPQLVADQVKEKFGGLRFYCHGGDDVTYGMIRLAESLSYRICEECGLMNQFVNQNGGGWIRTTCPSCAEDHLKEDHRENRRTDLINLWKDVIEDRARQVREQYKYGRDT